jgi:hypothetical protein
VHIVGDITTLPRHMYPHMNKIISYRKCNQLYHLGLYPGLGMSQARFMLRSSGL